MQEFLSEINKGLSPYKWKVTSIILAPHAPEQNPMEDVWLKSKNYLRQNHFLCGSWAQVKKLFVKATNIFNFDFNKLNEYIRHLQLI